MKSTEKSSQAGLLQRILAALIWLLNTAIIVPFFIRLIGQLSNWFKANYTLSFYHLNYDCWIGLYKSPKSGDLYIGYFPTLGIKLTKIHPPKTYSVPVNVINENLYYVTDEYDIRQRDGRDEEWLDSYIECRRAISYYFEANYGKKYYIVNKETGNKELIVEEE